MHDGLKIAQAELDLAAPYLSATQLTRATSRIRSAQKVLDNYGTKEGQEISRAQVSTVANLFMVSDKDLEGKTELLLGEGADPAATALSSSLFVMMGKAKANKPLAEQLDHLADLYLTKAPDIQQAPGMEATVLSTGLTAKALRRIPGQADNLIEKMRPDAPFRSLETLTAYLQAQGFPLPTGELASYLKKDEAGPRDFAIAAVLAAITEAE